VRLAQVFGREPLDFMLYFSSLQSFIKAPGQSNYAAGCTFTDAFAEWQSGNADYAVKVMNWGYWGSVGIVAGAEYRDRMTQAGVGSIEPREGMLALEQLLASPLPQVALVKTITAAATATLLQPGERVRLTVREAPSILGTLGSANTGPIEPVDDGRTQGEFDQLVAKLLLAQMNSVGAFAGEGIEAWRRKLGPSDLNESWIEETLGALAGQGYISRTNDGWKLEEGAPTDLQTVWDEWDRWKQTAEEDGQ
jgi:hypothetical protein